MNNLWKHLCHLPNHDMPKNRFLVMTLEIIGHQSNCLLFSQYDLTLGIFFCNITKEEATKRAFSPCISNRNHPSHAPLLSIPQTFPCISILFLDKWNKGHPWSKTDGIIERVRVFLTFECPWEGEGGGGSGDLLKGRVKVEKSGDKYLIDRQT